MAGRSTLAFYRDLSSNSAVEHCVRANFTHPSHVNLIVARASVLEVYLLHSDVGLRDGREALQKLCSYPVFGAVESLQVIRFSQSYKDSLLLGCMDAKLSVIDFDMATHSIVNRSLQQYEDKKYEIAGNLSAFPLVRVDPLNRCAAWLVYDKQLVVFPMHKAADFQAKDEGHGAAWGALDCFTINLANISVANVKDMVFLDGYDDPSLLILHEKKYTCPGRYAVLENTVAVTSLSLNLPLGSSSVIASFDSLPHSSFSLLAIPTPIGGAVIFSSNLCFHFNNQTVDNGLSVNEFGDAYNSCYLEFSSEVMHFDQSRALLVAPDRALISGDEGQMYVLCIGSRGQSKRLTLNYLGVGTFASCMCFLGNDMVFIGSRIADSLVVRCRERTSTELQQDAITFRALDSTAQGIEHKSSLLKQEKAQDPVELDELALMLRGDQQRDQEEEDVRRPLISRKKQVLTAAEGRVLGAMYELTVEDKLINLAPLADFAVGNVRIPDDDDDDNKEDSKERSRILELVGCSGVGAQGSLSICTQGIVPEIIGGDKCGTCNGCWAVRQQPKALKVGKIRKRESKRKRGGDVTVKDEAKTDVVEEKNEENLWDSFLLISSAKHTTVHSTGQEVQEAKNTEFYTDGPTVGVGNVFGSENGIVQVHRRGFRVLTRGGKQRQQMNLPEKNLTLSVLQCSIADPYVVLLMSDGTVRLLTAIPQAYRLENSKPTLHPLPFVNGAEMLLPAVTAVSLFKVPGLCVLFSPPKSTTEFEVQEQPKKESIYDNDELLEKMLYGSDDDDSSSGSLLSSTSASVSANHISQGSFHSQSSSSSAPSSTQQFVCCLYRGGCLEIYNVPSFSLIWRSTQFSQGDKVLTHSLDSPLPLGGYGVVELCLASIGSSHSPPFLFAFVDTGDLLVYKCFLHEESSTSLRMVRMFHNMIMRPLPKSKSNKPTKPVPGGGSVVWKGGSRLVVYSEVCGRSGILVGGTRPTWIFGERDFYRFHSMILNAGKDEEDDQENGLGVVSCSTPFHNVNCHRGFIYVDLAGNLNICLLPFPTTHVNVNLNTIAQKDSKNSTYEGDSNVNNVDTSAETLTVDTDSELCVKRIFLHTTPRFIAYHPATQTYAVVVSKKVETLSMEESTERSLPVYSDVFELLLYDSLTWKPIGRFDAFEEHEVVLCLSIVELDGENGGRRLYLCVGTSNMQGEDIFARGRVLILDLYYAWGVLHGGQKQRIIKIKSYAEKEKGPVTAICDIDDLLLLCIGPKIMLYHWDANSHTRTARAFFDAQFYIVSVQSIKKFICYADVYKSLYLLLWDPKLKTLSLLGTDSSPMEIMTTGFLVDGESLSMVACDGQANIHLLQYLPLRPESGPKGHQKLLHRGDFHVGSCLSRTHPLLIQGLPKESHRHKSRGEKQDIRIRTALLTSSLGGALGLLMPIDEFIYKRMYALNKKMTYNLPHLGGLNPRAYRLIPNQTPNENVVDELLLQIFPCLDLPSQQSFASAIGTTPAQIIENILQIQLSSRLF